MTRAFANCFGKGTTISASNVAVITMFISALLQEFRWTADRSTQRKSRPLNARGRLSILRSQSSFCDRLRGLCGEPIVPGSADTLPALFLWNAEHD